MILCPSAEAAETVLQTLREWSAQAGLTLHPEKTKIVDMGQPKAHFDFLGYRFWRSKTSGSIRRFIRPKSVKKIKEAIRPYTKRANGQSLEAIAQMIRPKLQGFFGQLPAHILKKSGWRSRCTRLKHAGAGALREVDGWIRGRLRSILRKRAGLKGRGRGRDHQRWNNHYFTQLGLFNLEAARELEIISLRNADNY